jgi:hypothetical protein
MSTDGTAPEPRRRRLIPITMTDALRQRLMVEPIDPSSIEITIPDAEAGWIWTNYRDAEGEAYWRARREAAGNVVAEEWYSYESTDHRLDHLETRLETFDTSLAELRRELHTRCEGLERRVHRVGWLSLVAFAVGAGFAAWYFLTPQATP